MRHVLECCCGANATLDSGGGDGWTVQRMREDYERWMEQHDGCPALYTPKFDAPPPPGGTCGTGVAPTVNNGGANEGSTPSASVPPPSEVPSRE